MSDLHFERVAGSLAGSIPSDADGPKAEEMNEEYDLDLTGGMEDVQVAQGTSDHDQGQYGC